MDFEYWLLALIYCAYRDSLPKRGFQVIPPELTPLHLRIYNVAYTGRGLVECWQWHTIPFSPSLGLPIEA